MKQKGFTLVELMVVAILIGIVSAVALPKFGQSISDYQLRTNADAYYALIRYARAEAVRSGRPIDVVPLDGVDWAQGIVAKDASDNVLREVVSKGSPLIQETGGVTSIRFNGRGYLPSKISLSVCDTRKIFSRQIEVLASGFVSMKAKVGGC